MVRKTTKAPEKLRPFLFHGVDITQDPKQAEGDCPFCDKDGHFYVKTETGQFHCVYCEAKGNNASFLQKLHQWAVKDTTDKDLEDLAEDRKIDVATLREWGVAVHPLTNNEFLIPAFNNRGKIANLMKAYQTRDGWRVIATPTMKLHPLGLQFHNKRNQSVVWVAEGPWDAMKLWETMQQVKRVGDRFIRTTNGKAVLSTKETVIAVPGSGTFQQDWLDILQGKTVRLFFDNDHPRKTPQGTIVKPGWDGMKRIGKLMEDSGKVPKVLQRVRWGRAGYDPERKPGFDLRDIFLQYGPVRGMKTAVGLLEKVKLDRSKSSPTENDDDGLEPLPRTSFTELVEDYQANLHFTGQLRDTLAVMLACVISTDLDGDQVWLRIIGPPGSGKSTLAEAIGATRDYAFNVSNITGLHSGFVGGENARKKDASLIPKMKGKTTIIKDGDTLLNAPNRDRILAELRDIYDGTSRATYRNRVSREYNNVKATFILCGTDELKSLHRPFLGERFLNVEILGNEDRTPYLDRALNNAFDSVFASFKPESNGEDLDRVPNSRMTHLKRATAGLIHHFKDNWRNMNPPQRTKEAEETLRALGQFLSFMRARVKRESGEVLYRPRVELATRVIGQLTKLAVCVALVVGKKTIDKEVLGIVRKVALDTAEGFQLEVTKTLAGFKTDGMTVGQLELKLRLSEGTVRNLLRDMREFGIVERISKNNKSGQRGRNRHLWRLTDEVRDIYKIAIGKGK